MSRKTSRLFLTIIFILAASQLHPSAQAQGRIAQPEISPISDWNDQAGRNITSEWCRVEGASLSVKDAGPATSLGSASDAFLTPSSTLRITFSEDPHTATGNVQLNLETKSFTHLDSPPPTIKPNPINSLQPNSPDVVSHAPIEWRGLLIDSTRFLIFQHAFRLATETDTRNNLGGPFFGNYAAAVSNIHGWNDGDPFFVNYIDHPMEGSVAGFLEVAHDPRYRDAQFGKSSHYWKSRFRATAYSAVFSLQFEIGPVSEASIGHIQTEPQKTGVVDWVITPTVGLGWMILEDSVDRFIIAPNEIKTSSHLKRIFLRSLLNPTRSFSNMMQWRRPWDRDTRPGVSHF